MLVFRDAMPDNPPGSTTSVAIQGYANLEISQSLDAIFSSTAAAGTRGYFTKYYPEGYPCDLAWGAWTGQTDGSTKWPGWTVPHFNTAFVPTYVFMEAGIAYLARSGGTLYQNTMYAVPFGADWNFVSTTNSRIIAPALSTLHAERLTRVYVCCARLLGSHKLGTIPEPYRVFARTTGIADNSGTWTKIEGGDLTSLPPTDQIQFMFEFRTIGTLCVPARIHSVAVVYEVPKTDPHFEPTLRFNYLNAPKFAWWFKTAFGCDVPKIRVRIWDADTEELLSDDNTDIRTGRFEKSIDNGVTWTDWNNIDKTNETTYVRYTYRAGTSTIVRSRLKAILSLV